MNLCAYIRLGTHGFLKALDVGMAHDLDGDVLDDGDAATHGCASCDIEAEHGLVPLLCKPGNTKVGKPNDVQVDICSHFMVTSDSDAAVLDEFCAVDGPAADRRAARRASAEREMVISLLLLDCMRYSVKSDETLICLKRGKATHIVSSKGVTYDQTWMPPSLTSPAQMMRISCSANLIVHFFCSFSTDCTISVY